MQLGQATETCEWDSVLQLRKHLPRLRAWWVWWQQSRWSRDRHSSAGWRPRPSALIRRTEAPTSRLIAPILVVGRTMIEIFMFVLVMDRLCKVLGLLTVTYFSGCSVYFAYISCREIWYIGTYALIKFYSKIGAGCRACVGHIHTEMQLKNGE